MAESNKNTPSLPRKASTEIGASGTAIFKGYITSEEYVVDLQGMYGLNQYDIMRRSDATVHGVLQVVKNPIISATWDIEPASDENADVEIANFVKREMFERKIMMQDVFREALTSLDFGHAVMEKVYEVTTYEGKPHIGLAKIASRKQRSILKWETNDEKPGITQILPTGDSRYIPREKLIYVTNEKEGDNHLGISLLRFAYKPWKIKDALELMNAIALEKLSIPVPILRKGVNNISVQEADLIRARVLLKNWRANQSAYLELPAGLEIEFPAINGASVKDTLPTIQHQNEQIWSSVLASFMSLGQGGNGGSRALSGDLTTMFYKSLEAVARSLQQSFQNDLVQDLVDLNFSDLPNGYPKLVFSNISDDDFKAIADATSNLMNAGAIHADAEVENRLRTMLGLPEMSDDMSDGYDKLTKPVAEPADAPVADKAKKAPAKSDDKNMKDAKDQHMDVDKKTTAHINASVAAHDYKGIYESMGIDEDDLGCIMLDVQPLSIKKYVTNADADLYIDTENNHKNGAIGEHEAHVTLLFGLLANGNTMKPQVDTVLRDWNCSGVTIDYVDAFQVPADAPAVPIVGRIWSEDVRDANDRLSLLPHVKTFSEFNPHVTLAWVKNDPDVVQKWVKTLNKEIAGTKLGAIGINYGDMPKQDKDDLVTAARQLNTKIYASIFGDE